MSLPINRTQLKDWCLRKLGAPVIAIDVEDTQVEDRIDEAVERFQEHHFDGVERIYMKRQVTASVMKFISPIGFTFGGREKIIGSTSGATAFVVDQAGDNESIRFVSENGTFNLGEDVVGNSGSATISSDTDSIVIGDIDNGYIPCEDSIISIVGVVSMPGMFGAGLFSLAFQQALQVLPIWPKGDLSYFYQQRQYLHLLEEIFIGDKTCQFNRVTNRLYINIDWRNGIDPDDYIIVEAYKAINPETYKRVYSNWFVREYTTSLIKKQWGQNLTKFKKISMAGGVLVSGDDIYKQAEKELKDLEKRLRNELQVPPGFFVG